LLLNSGCDCEGEGGRRAEGKVKRRRQGERKERIEVSKLGFAFRVCCASYEEQDGKIRKEIFALST
jgi:hypothetical protein